MLIRDKTFQWCPFMNLTHLPIIFILFPNFTILRKIYVSSACILINIKKGSDNFEWNEMITCCAKHLYSVVDPFLGNNCVKHNPFSFI